MRSMLRRAAAGLFLLAGCAANDGGCNEAGDPFPDFDASCGPCSAITDGVPNTGLLSLDALLGATGSLSDALVTARVTLDTQTRALADAFGVPLADGALSVEAIDGLFDAIEADLSAAGSISVQLRPARCQANLAVSTQAQLNCEVDSGCAVELEAPTASVSCEGTCSGACEGTCEGMVACTMPPDGAFCEGSCEGTCALEQASPCEGLCEGSCSIDGDVEQDFSGVCAGECQGTCTPDAGADCVGTCHGTCVLEDAGACEGTVSCRGACDGSCQGQCQGAATPGAGSADCEATAECQTAASMQGTAALRCSPPTLGIDVAFAADLDVNAQAAVRARLGALQRHGGAVLLSGARLSALLDGDFNGDGEAEVDPLPAQLEAVFQGMVDDPDALLSQIPAGKVNCVIPVLTDAAASVARIRAEGLAVFELQVAFTTRMQALGR
ncbi:MAG: hypothetical protein AAGA54_26480 [Myxococcota bacterium]